LAKNIPSKLLLKELFMKIIYRTEGFLLIIREKCRDWILNVEKGLKAEAGIR
jgi:hypothetical protein